MPVPFRDLRAEENLGLAVYLRFINEADARGMRGALFLINARGEPLDFVFSRVDVTASFLWKTGEGKRRAVADLAVVLFQACPKAPSVVLALHDEVHPRLFIDDLVVEVPLCRVAEGEAVAFSREESMETFTNSLHLFWVGERPSEASPARHLINTLHARQLLTEPFERAAKGLEEAFRE